jgi:tetratricopeptide (TPR) repeat protein
MASSKGLVSLAFAASLLVLAGPAARASSTGGNGGGGAPSITGPSYDPVAEYRKGVAAIQAQKFKDAISAFDNVLSVAPNDTNTLLLKGLAQSNLNDLKGAQRSYQSATRSNSKLPAPHRELGLVDLKLGQAPQAQKERDALQALATKCNDTCPEAADIKADIASLDAAMAGTAKPSAMLTPGPLFGPTQGDAAYMRAVSLINEHRYEDAIASLQGAQMAFGPHPDVLTYIGFSYRKLKQYDEAERYYKQALAVSPNHRGATEYYGELKVERGDIAGAKVLLAKLDNACAFGCPEAEELRRWIDGGVRL